MAKTETGHGNGVIV